jgi:hypothetical protein
MRGETTACRLSTALARIRTKLDQGSARSDAAWAGMEMMSARDDARWARFEARRAGIEAKLAHIRIPALAISEMSFPAPKVSVCPRVRVSIPRMPKMQMVAPVVRVESVGAGPV